MASRCSAAILNGDQNCRRSQDGGEGVDGVPAADGAQPLDGPRVDRPTSRRGSGGVQHEVRQQRLGVLARQRPQHAQDRRPRPLRAARQRADQRVVRGVDAEHGDGVRRLALHVGLGVVEQRRQLRRAPRGRRTRGAAGRPSVRTAAFGDWRSRSTDCRPGGAEGDQDVDQMRARAAPLLAGQHLGQRADDDRAQRHAEALRGVDDLAVGRVQVGGDVPHRRRRQDALHDLAGGRAESPGPRDRSACARRASTRSAAAGKSPTTSSTLTRLRASSARSPPVRPTSRCEVHQVGEESGVEQPEGVLVHGLAPRRHHGRRVRAVLLEIDGAVGQPLEAPRCTRPTRTPCRSRRAAAPPTACHACAIDGIGGRRRTAPARPARA